MYHRIYTILIVEDNEGDLILVEDFIFEEIEAPVLLTARTCFEAVTLLSNVGLKIDIVLLDLSLPDKTGESLIREILACSAGSPVIVLTGYSDFSFGVRSLSMGIADYILKEELTSSLLYKSMIYSIERRKNLLELEGSEKRYSDLFNLSPLPMWVFDLKTLKFTDVNHATLKHYGYGREEFLNMTLRDIRPEHEMYCLDAALADKSTNYAQPRHRTMIHQKKNGELINVEIQISPVPNKGGDLNLVIATDITERTRYIKAIEEQNEKLKEISWMQSHIIRAPLSRIMGLIPLIADANSNGENSEEMLEYLNRSANELDTVIKQITDKSQQADFDFPEPMG